MLLDYSYSAKRRFYKNFFIYHNTKPVFSISLDFVRWTHVQACDTFERYYGLKTEYLYYLYNLNENNSFRLFAQT